MLDTRVHLAIWAYTGLHLIVAALLPMAPHEIHYTSYALHLDWSYLDHPPLAAWLQAPVAALTDSSFAARLVPITLSVITLYLLALLARRTVPEGPTQLPLIAVLILQGTLMFHGAMVLSPDAALLPVALGVALALCRALTSDRYLDWLLLGLLLGLAGLAKYTAFTLAISVTVLAVLARGPGILVSGRLWLAGAACLLVISPVLAWNAARDWITISFHSGYQFEDVARWSATALAVSAATQLALYSPLLLFGGLAALPGSLRRTAERWSDRWPTLLGPVFAIPPLLLYLLAALESRASPHWSVLGWLFLIVPTAAWVLSGWRRAGVRTLTYTSVAYSLAVLVALAVILLPVGRWPDYAQPIKLVVGWPEATERGVALLESLDRTGRTTEPELLARNWHHIPIFERYAPDVPIRSLFNDLNPYNLRNGIADHQTWGVLIYPGEREEPRNVKSLTSDFHCEPIDRLEIERAGSRLQTVHYYRCESLLPETKTPG